MRIAICQPLIPAYRQPLFERLGALPGVDLTVYAGHTLGSLEAFHDGNSYRAVPAPVHQWGFGFRGQLAQLSVLMRRPLDLLIAPWDLHYLTLMPAVAAARSMRVPVVLWGHGYSQRPRAWSDAVRNAWGRWADAVLLYTRSIAEQLIREARFARDRVFVAQNALDQTPIQEARRHWLGRPQQLIEFQRAHHLDPGQTLLFVSRLEPANRIELLLQATQALASKRPAIKTVIIGRGPAREALERLANELGIADRVIFPGPIYVERELAPWMLSGALFCYPTNIGLSLLHAAGYGLPTVTSNNRAMQNPEIEALIPESNGLEYEDGSLADLVRQCARILDDAALRERLASGALAAIERYSMEHMVEGFCEVFDWAKHRRNS